MLQANYLPVLTVITLLTYISTAAAMVHALDHESDTSLSPLRKRATTMKCTGQLPPQADFPWPYQRTDFNSVRELCSLDHTGCECVGETVVCIADPGWTTDLNAPFSSFCKQRCFCEDPNKENVDPTVVDPNTGANADVWWDWTLASDLTPSDSVSAPAAPTPDSATSSSAPASRPIRCGGKTCWNARSCSNGGKSCSCTADLSGSVGRYRAACGIQLTPRALGSNSTFTSNQTERPIANPVLTPVACPCNCTYISAACCQPEAAASGYVQEDASKKLGVLVVPDGMCCNKTSGDLQDLPLTRNLTSVDGGCVAIGA